MWFWNGGFWGGWIIFGMVFMFIFWAAIIWLIVWGIRRATHHTYMSGNPGGDMTPLDIAKARYARGEITKEQFDQLKKDL